MSEPEGDDEDDVAPIYMLDTSALARSDKPKVAPRLKPLIDARLVARCSPTDLEAGVTAVNGDDHARIRSERSEWPTVEMEQRIADRALEVQGALSKKGQHRGVKITDLLIAASAETAGLAVLHYDRDFDRIADVTGQVCEWIAPAGEAD